METTFEHFIMTYYQWPFQEPKFEVPTIYKAYFSGLNFREYPHNSYGPKYGTFTYLHVLDPEDLPLTPLLVNSMEDHPNWKVGADVML